MTQIYLALHGALAVLRPHNGHWQAELALVDQDCQCLAVDPYRPQRVYCGTFAAGLWVTDDAGRTWQPVVGQLPIRRLWRWQSVHGRKWAVLA